MITIKKSEQGTDVTINANKPEYGYITLVDTVMVKEGTFLKKKERSFLLQGLVPDLQEFAKFNKTISGRINVIECLEDEIPASLQNRLDKNKTLSENIDRFAKRAGENGPVLTFQGKTILRFTDWDETGTVADIRVAHDNTADVIAYNATVKAQASQPAPANKKPTI